MNLRQNESKRMAVAPAKLNIYLEVLGRRADGYHELETLMVPLRLFDSITFTTEFSSDDGRPREIQLTRRGRQEFSCLPGGQDYVALGADNLIVRALELFRQRSGCDLGAHVELVKRIPSAAGLGGGSSDAAAALLLANRGWRIHWNSQRLATLAAELGSDVPFFLSPGAAICRGRGERIERLWGLVPLAFVIIKPPVALRTPDVYARLNKAAVELQENVTYSGHRRRIEALVGALRRGTLRELGQWMNNGLQTAAASLSPWIERVREACAALDFVAHQLSGSGSAYFGVCRHAQHARRLATILRTRQLGLVFVTRSCC